MEKSESITELAKALTKFQSAVKAVKRNGVNPHFKSNYATLEDIIEAVRQPLADNGLAFSQLPAGEDELATVLMHTSGEFIRSTAKMRLSANTAQGQGSAMTYMRRYALSSLLGLATEDDDDGNVASAPARPAAKMPVKKPGNAMEIARAFIKKASTIDNLMKLDDRVKASKDFTADQKLELARLIQTRAELINVTT